MILEVFKASTKEEVNSKFKELKENANFKYTHSKMKIVIVAVNKDLKCDGYIEI